MNKNIFWNFWSSKD